MGPFAEDEGAPPGRPAKGERPEWLVGADEGLEIEFGPGAPSGKPASPPRLSRPDGSVEGNAVPPVVARPRLTRPDAGGAAPPPRLPEQDDAPPLLAGLTKHVEWTPAAESNAATSAADKTPEPVAFEPEAPPRAPLRAAEPQLPAAGAPAPGAEEPATARALTVAMRVARRSWRWVVGAGAAALLGVVVADAAGVGKTSIRDILRHPVRYDGRVVRVRGHVSQDVFPVGGGYTFYLLRGNDSLVVFTRSRVPTAGQSLEIDGEVSTGTVAGVDRPALLEQVR